MTCEEGQNHGDNGGSGDSDRILQGIIDYMHTLVPGVGGSTGSPAPVPSHLVTSESDARQPPVLQPKTRHGEVGTSVVVNGDRTAGGATLSPAPVLPPRKRDKKPTSPVSAVVLVVWCLWSYCCWWMRSCGSCVVCISVDVCTGQTSSGIMNHCYSLVGNTALVQCSQVVELWTQKRENQGSNSLHESRSEI